MKKIILACLAVMFLCTYSAQAAQLVFYGFEDWDGNMYTTPTYLPGSSTTAGCTAQSDLTEVVASWNGNTPYTGNYFMMANISGHVTDPVIPNTNIGAINPRLQIGVGSGGVCGNNSYQTPNPIAQLFIRCRIKANGISNITSSTSRLKLIAFYSTSSGYPITYVDGSSSPIFELQTNLAHAYGPSATTLYNGQWHWIAMMYDHTNSYSYFWYDVEHPSLTNYTIRLSQRYNSTIVCNNLIENWSSFNPTGPVWFALDDIEVWDGLPSGETDTTSPTINQYTAPVIAANGTTATVTFSETVVTTGYDNGDFVITGSVSGDVNLNSITGSGNTRSFTLASSIKDGETCTLKTGASYGANEIEDASGNDMVAFSGTAVTNNSTVDGTAPTLSNVVITDATHTQFTFSEVVTESGTGSAWNFVLSGGEVVLSSPQVVGSVITYTNSRSVANGEALSDLDYTQPGNGIEDAAGNDLVSISNYAGDFTNSVEATDVTDPVITITTPADNPYTSESQFITVEGTASDNVGVDSVIVSCPTCQAVGANTGSLTAWSFPVTLSQGALGSDLLNGMGDFTSNYEWYYGTAWSLADGAMTSSGASISTLNINIENLEDNATYEVSFDVTAFTSGDLWLSQSGFSAATFLNGIDGTGSYSFEVVCIEPGYPLKFVANPWAGTLDNVEVRKKGYNEITVTAHDAAANTGSDTVSVAFVAPDEVTPRRVMGLSATVKLDIGNRVQLEY